MGTEIPIDFMIRGVALMRLIDTACRIGIADNVSDERPKIDSLAAALGVPPQPLFRLLRCLSGFGIFSLDQEQRVGHTEESLRLRAGGREAIQAAIEFWSADFVANAWARLAESMNSDADAFTLGNGADFFSFAENPTVASTYNTYMSKGYSGRIRQVARRLPVGAMSTLVDVGGGNGALLSDLLEHYPHLQATLYERPAALGELVEKTGLPFKLEAGDFFTSVPGGADGYLLSWILHDWDDAHARKILTNCCVAMKACSQLFVIDRVLQDRPQDCSAKDTLLDLNMFVLHKGRERSFGDFVDLGRDAGFNRIELISTAPNFAVIAMDFENLEPSFEL